MSYSPDYLDDLLHPGLINIDRFKLQTGVRKDPRAEKPETPCVAWQEMAHDWQVVRDLLGGTRGMRAAGARYLPRMVKERDDDYAFRRETSFLIDMLEDTIDEMVSKPFSRAISFSGEVPTWVEELNEDVDGNGTSIHEFAKNLLREAVKWGVAHLAVDVVGMPTELPDDPQVRDFGDARPRFRIIPGPNMLRWKRSEDRGRPITEVRFYERVVDELNIIELLHVWNATDMLEMVRDRNEQEFKAKSQVAHRMGAIPIATLYTNHTGEFTAKPPFMDVAWINVDHWQSYSDQRQILHVARVPLLFKKGFDSKTPRQQHEVSTKRVNSTSNTNADMRYVEVSGASMQQGDNHLRALQDTAREKGAKPLYSRGPITATGEVRADSKATCDLQGWCEALERVLQRGYRFAQLSRPGLAELAQDFRPQVFTEFDLGARSSDDLAGLRADRVRGDISRTTYLSEAKRRSLLHEDFDADEDLRQIQAEAAEGIGVGAFSAGAFEEDEDEDDRGRPGARGQNDEDDEGDEGEDET